MLITHDLGVVAEMASAWSSCTPAARSRRRRSSEIFARPLHPYTRGLLGAVPKLGSSLAAASRSKLAEIRGLVPSLRQRIVGCPFAGRCPMATDLCRQVTPALESKAPDHLVACHYAERERWPHERQPPLLEVNGLKKHFPDRRRLARRRDRRQVYAVDGVTFDIPRGRDPVAGRRVRLRQVDRRQGDPAAVSSRPTARSYLDGERIDNLPAAELRPLRRRMQVVFQDPFSSPQSAHAGARHPGRAPAQFRPWRIGGAI